MEKNYRHEYKFMISRCSAELLRRRLPCIMQRDSHAGPTGQYTIRSLYFDDFENRAFEEKVSGVNERTKYRIRYYNYDDSVIKLERKEKLGSLTRKEGATITREEAMALQQPGQLPWPDSETPLVRELMRQCDYSGLRPRVLVDYDRTPFVCRDGNTRITLDDHLRTKPYSVDLYASSAAMIPVLEPDEVILEVKFDDFLPGYLSDVLEDIPKNPMAISKFALCMNLL